MRAAGDPELKVYGIFGYPLGHTVSPAIQNCAFEHHKLKSIYFAFERPPARFRFLMQNLKSLVLDGFNITVPFKEEVIPYLDRLSPETKAIGAVNTVKKEKGRWIGYNTDSYGFLTSLRKEERFNPRGKHILLLGAGGAARAVAYGLGQSGAKEIRIINREKFRYNRIKIIRQFRKIFPQTLFVGFSLNGPNLIQALKGVELVINATSVGVKFEEKRLIPTRLIPKAHSGHRLLFFDLVYHRSTPFLEDAKKKGHRILDGKGMLVYQGAKAFQIWTGKRAPVSQMKKALQDALRSQ